MTEYTEYISEPWFTLIKLRIKKCEGRINKDNFRKMKEGDIIKFTNNDFGKERSCMVEIRFRRFYNTFKELLLHETLDNCLPGIDSIDEGLNVYYIQNYIDEQKNLVAPLQIVAMGIKLIDEDDYLA